MQGEEHDQWVVMEEADIGELDAAASSSEEVDDKDPYAGYKTIPDAEKVEDELVIDEEEWKQVEEQAMSGTADQWPPATLTKMLPRRAVAVESVLSQPLELPPEAAGGGFASRFDDIDFVAVQKIAAQIQVKCCLLFVAGHLVY